MCAEWRVASESVGAARDERVPHSGTHLYDAVAKVWCGVKFVPQNAIDLRFLKRKVGVRHVAHVYNDSCVENLRPRVIRQKQNV